MKIGTRISITTVALVMATLGLYGLVTVRARRAEVAADLERQTWLVGNALQVSLEALLPKSHVEDLTRALADWQAAEPNIRLAFIDMSAVAQPGFVLQGAGFAPPPSDPTRTARLARLAVGHQAVGQHVTVGGRAVYALTVPIRDLEGADKKLVAAIELLRDEGDAQLAMSASIRTAIYAVGGLTLLLALLVWWSARSTISSPLNRLVEAIDDVTAGDLGRVILGKRDDEIGELADRFNEMTGSLREARAQILAGVDAKLALEARLRHSEKLATIGQLAAGIAHEVGTPLNVIGGRARTMEKRAGEAMKPGAQVALDPEEVSKNAAIIAAQTQRITKIIQQLLDFARRPQAVRTDCDLAAIGKGCLDFLEHQMVQHRVEARQRPFVGEAGAPVTPVVVGDGDQLQQVCLNLCLNAIQAMPQGGQLELGTRTLVRRRPGLDAAAPGRYVVLEVADTGVGIPEGDRERIFEPFYSTKPASADGREGGTGLGLSVSHGIVKDHDGWIEIDHRQGGGTVFRVFLPAGE